MRPSSRQTMLRMLLVLVAGSSTTVPSARGEEAAPVRCGGRLASGSRVDFALHRPVNALETAVRADGAVIAATEDGRLLRCEGPRLEPTREHDARVLGSRIICLGRGEGETVLAGFGDGRIARVDPKSLETESIARIDHHPRLG